MPRCFRRFMVVERSFTGCDFPVTFMTSVTHLDENNAALLCYAEAGLEWMEQLHSQLAQFNLPDEHATLPGRTNRRSILQCARNQPQNNRREDFLETAPAHASEHPSLSPGSAS